MINDILGDLSSKGYDRKVQKLRPAFLAEVHCNLWSRSGQRRAGGGYQEPVPSELWGRPSGCCVISGWRWRSKERVSIPCQWCKESCLWRGRDYLTVEFSFKRCVCVCVCVCMPGDGFADGQCAECTRSSHKSSTANQQRTSCPENTMTSSSNASSSVGLCPVQHIWGSGCYFFQCFHRCQRCLRDP